MTTRMKKTITTSLPQEELAALDRLREQQNLTRSQALREAVRWYIGAMHQLPQAEEPLPDDLGTTGPRSGEVLAEVLGHLEHGHFVLAEDFPELVIGEDFAAVLRVLQVVRLDVVPNLARHLAPRHRVGADDRSKLRGWL